MIPSRLTLLSLLSVCAAGAQAATAAPETFFEIETAAAAPWTTASGSEANTTYAVMTSAAGQATPLTVDIKAGHLATYYVWVRFIAPNSTANQFTATLDSGTTRTISTTSYGTTGQWKLVDSASFAAGSTHTLRINATRLNVGFDRLIVTTQPFYTPQGAGSVPTASNSIPANPYAGTPPPILPPPDHPRLFIGDQTNRKALIESRRQAGLSITPGDRDHELMARAWKALNDAAQNPATMVDAPTFGECAVYRKIIQGKALAYQLDGTSAMGDGAVAMMRKYINVCGFVKDDKGNAAPMGTRPTGEMILLSALVYDWCEPKMTAADKELFVQRFLERAKTMEIGFPPVKQGHVTGHGSETQLMRDQMSAAIAFYEKSPEIYNIVAGRFFKDFVPTRTTLYKNGAFHQGQSYGQARFVSDMFAAWIFKRMSDVDVFKDPDSGAVLGREQLYNTMYMRRPDGQVLRDGDVFDGSYTKPWNYWFQHLPYLLAANYFDDAYLKREYILQTANVGEADDIWLALFNRMALKPATTAPALPLTRFYDAPAGYMVARTGWNDKPVDPTSNVVIATMKVGHTNFTNHQHLDAGHFQLYYKGALAIDSGLYGGISNDKEVEYGSDHDKNYYKRTIAHNAMLVFQEGETFVNGIGNEGGQTYIAREPFSLDDLTNPAYQNVYPYVYGGAIRRFVGPDANKPAFSYLAGNLAGAYNASKVAHYQRSFVFLNLDNADVPGALVVFDRIRSTQPQYPKRWLLHSINKPVVAGDTVTIERTEGDYNGKLVNRTLLPKQILTSEVQGFVVPDQHGVNNVEYPIVPKSAADRQSEEPGGWRVEISPSQSEPNKADVMLNVMQVMDAGKAPLDTELVDDGDFVGVRIGKQAALFARAETAVGTKASFVLTNVVQPLDTLVTDLAPGTWSVSRNNITLGRYSVSAENGSLLLRGLTNGTYTLTAASKSP